MTQANSHFQEIVNFVKELYSPLEIIPLHAPIFCGNEKRNLIECIDSTFVSSVGPFVGRFEEALQSYTNAPYAIATVNGTSALHVALLLVETKPGDEVITQDLGFIASANAISYCQATPVFIDVDRDTLSMSPDSLGRFLCNETERKGKYLYNKTSGKRISAIVPMHTFGHIGRIKEIVAMCEDVNLPVVEDAAEALGSWRDGQHAGNFGTLGILSFNGNKIVTAGGGGAILTHNHSLAARAKHLTTTARIKHNWKFVHDEIGFNYRMPNLNAALALAQLEQLDLFVESKRQTAHYYKSLFEAIEDVQFFSEPLTSTSNYWLNAILFDAPSDQLRFLEFANERGVTCRPCWELLHTNSAFTKCQVFENANAQAIHARLVNIPSSARI